MTYHLFKIKSLLLLTFMSINAFAFQQIANEAQFIMPSTHSKFIKSLNLNNQSSDWKDSIINIVIVGKDKPMELPYPQIQTENGMENRLASRGDANLLISINKIQRTITLFSMVRDTPDLTDNNEILTHQYLLKGRQYYLNLVKNKVSTFAKSQGLSSQLGIDKGKELKIHGLLEIDFSSFNNSIRLIKTNLISSATLAWNFKAHISELLNVLSNEKSILRELRARKNYSAGGYQRSYNHGLFVQNILGIVAYTIEDNNDVSFLKNPVIQGAFNEMSRTFELNDLLNSLETSKDNSLLKKAYYIKDYSMIDHYLLGILNTSFLKMSQGRALVVLSPNLSRSENPLDLLLEKVKTDFNFIQPKNCYQCK